MVVSAPIIAGGDDTASNRSASASADFWGQVGFAYQAQDEDWKGYGFGDKEDNAFSAAVILGVEKAWGLGLGFGAEVAGWSDLGLDIADKARVESGDQTAAEISQAYLMYRSGETAVKVGRQALPKALSPWAWTVRTAGVVDWAYDGVLVTNTALPDTTMIGGWVMRISHSSDEEYRISDRGGLLILGAVNRSIPDTKVSVSGYYLPKSLHDINRYDYGAGGIPVIDNGAKDVWSIWADSVTNYHGAKVGIQGVYVDGDYAGTGATYAVAGKIASSLGRLNATIAASYINNGDYSLRLAGTKLEDSALWTDNEESGDIIRHYNPLVNMDYSQGQVAVLATFGYRLAFGRLYGSLGYWDYDHARSGDQTESFGGRVGYGFDLSGVRTRVEYRYRDRALKESDDQKRQRIRIEAYYKF